MKCPTCSVPLVMSERQGIEIDYCPQCRGIWLDRGELDKIIERSTKEMQGSTGPVASNHPPQQSHQPQYGHEPQYGYHKHHKKKHWLNELFD
ncbi:MAG: zf-TFIIB domain-containing protein [Bacteroidota bacterium]